VYIRRNSRGRVNNWPLLTRSVVACRILVRAISYTVHGLIPASCVFADRYNREEVVRSLGKEINLNPPLVLGQLPDTADELLKLDQVFMKSELKVGVIYVKEGQTTEEEILDNNDNSLAFEEFLGLLGETKRLCGTISRTANVVVSSPHPPIFILRASYRF